MIKKILSIGVIGMFFILGVVTISAEKSINLDEGESDVRALVVRTDYPLIKVKDAIVEAEHEDGTIFSMSWDESVEAHRAHLPASDEKITIYTITVKAEGYKAPEPKELSLILIPEDDYIEVLFTMEKKSKSTFPILCRLSELFPNAFPLLRLLLKL